VPIPASELKDHVDTLAARHEVSVDTVIATAALVLLSRYHPTGDVRATVETIDGVRTTRRLSLQSPAGRRMGELVADVNRRLRAGDDSATPTQFRIVIVRGPDAPPMHGRDGLVMRWNLTSDGARARIHYGADAHARWLAKQFGSHFLRVLRDWRDHPETQAARIPLLDERETELLLAHGTGSRRDYPLDRTLLSVFDERVASMPDRFALIEEAATITYRELQTRVDALARRLAARQIAPGAVVGVCIERSIELVVAMLAVWRAGGVYLPLDRSYPAEYLRLLIEDARAELVLDGQVVDGWRESRTAHRDAAVLMYTSGSTGKPKGVLHSERQIINRLHWMWETYPFRDDDVIAQRSPANVMPSMWELLGGLLAGVPTVIVPERIVRDPAELARFVARHRITFMTMTPTLLQLMLTVREHVEEWPADLRLMIVGGETVTERLIGDVRNAFPHMTLVNDFGATEVNTVLHAVAGQPYRPIANVSTFLLDEFLRLVPFGVEGELCVAGPAVALGYLHRQELTAERFVEARPGGDGPPLRLYRTGDIGFMTPDGGIHINGRRDHQVKIHGMRVELGEIERALAADPDVSSCIVVDRGESSQRALHAYVVPRDGATPDERDLRARLRQRLPPYMVPARFDFVSELPRRPNGKVDRLALGGRASPSLAPGETSAPLRTVTARLVCEAAARAVGDDDVFDAIGLDSVAIIELAGRLSAELHRSVPPPMLIDHPTIARLTKHLSSECGGGRAAAFESPSSAAALRSAIAIIGMSGRFPGAAGVDEFWHNLRNGVESIGTVAPGRWDAQTIYDERRSSSKWGGFLSDADRFDAAFFGIAPSDARLMDPQQRIALMAAWHALEDSGYAGRCLAQQTAGVFIGARESDYVAVVARAGCAPSAATLLGNDLALLAARIAYFCDLHGPSMVVDTACSSSLVAVHLACRSLLDGECTIALAGGVCVTNDPDFYVATSQLNIFSPTGHCRAFDDAADGFVHGEGAGFVVLKPLASAVADGDRIYAVIRGTAVNQDGRSNGITAPNGEAQAELQESLYRKFGIDPDTISYVEAHGTATRLGDPIEVQALARSFARFTTRRRFCALGSVKTNIGHLTAAAGVAGLIKTTLCLEHRELVPSLHFTRANALIDFDETPFYVNTANRPWDAAFRRAAINAFGIGGTNAHCVLEEAPLMKPALSSADAYVVPVTGPDADALRRVMMALYQWSANASDAIRDVAYTLTVGRRVFGRGYAFLVRSVAELHERLGEALEGNAIPVDLGDIAALQRRFENEKPRRIRLPLYPFDLQRYWVDDDEAIIQRSTEPLSVADAIASAVGELLGIDPSRIDRSRPLRTFGFDSIKAVALSHALEQRLNISIAVESLFGDACIDSLVSSASDAANESAYPRWVSAGDAHEPFPLSDLQAAHLVARQMPELDPVGCHVYLEFTVNDLDVDRLERAWRRLMEIHPMLRARIHRDGTQSIARHMPFAIVRSTETAEHVRGEMSHKVYRVGDEPLFEIRVTTSRVHVSMDSWIVDGASANLLYRQWRLLYESPESIIEPADATYRDFVLTTKAFEGSAAVQRSLEYWKEKLREVPDGPSLPRTESPSRHARERWEWTCAPDSWSRFRELAATERVSVSAALLGIVAEQLRSAGAGERFALVLTLHNRPPIHPRIDEVVGPFSSTVIFIADDELEPSFAARLHTVQRQLWRDLDHAQVSGVAAMRAVSSGAMPKRFPVVFTSALAVDGERSPSWLDDVDFAVSQTPGVDLHIQFYERADGMHMAWDVACKRLDRGALQALFDSTCAAVKGFSEGAEVPSAYARRQYLESAQPESRMAMTPLQQAYGAQRLMHRSELAAIVYRELDVAGLDARQLPGIVNAMIDASPILRALPRWDNATFVEFTNASVPVPVDDLRGAGAEAVAAHLASVRAEMERAMGEWPPLGVRASLLDGGVTRVQVLLDMVVFDGYGTWLFYDELLRRWDGTVAGGLKPAAPRDGFARYASARERYRGSAAYRLDQAYWRRKAIALAGGNADREETVPSSSRFTLTFDRWSPLVEKARERGVLEIALLATVLADVTRVDVVTIADYRQRKLVAGWESAYGDFTSLSWVRTGGSPIFEERLRKTAATIERDAMHDWGNPFEAFRGATAASTAVLTNCLDAPPLHGATEVCASSSTPGVDIDVMVTAANGVLRADWQVRTDRIDAGIAATMVDDFGRRLRAWIDDETSTARATWNDTDADYDREKCLHRLFEERARADGDRVALVTDNVVMTYTELDRNANRLARVLLRHGVRNGAFVAVLLDRSAEMIATLLAILKCGAAYVPLSFSDPRQRIATMLDRARVTTIVTTTAHASLLGSERDVILLDQAAAAIARESDEAPAIETTSDDVAYVIFTSGSTGEPKGVVVTHRPVINLIEWARSVFAFEPDDRVLFVNALGFDLAVFDVFAFLAYGASIRLVSDEDRLDAGRLARMLANEPITFWNSAPAYLQFVLPALELRREASTLRRVFLSGDWIPLDLPGRVRSLFPAAEVIALGGATEATVWSNYFRIGDVDPAWTSIPYGCPIQNARYYILDEQLQPCAAGIAGELYIGGECLSSGYINAPELTAARFLLDPFHERSGMTMYRTGDLARVMSDGATIEFLGRTDTQVKIRGFRIELAEVDAAIVRAGLANGVTVVREDAPGNRVLVAFGASSNTGPITDEAFWNRVREHLPQSMTPSLAYALKAMPMTANGKVDRKTLMTTPIAELLGTSSGAAAAEDQPGGRSGRRSTLTQFICTAIAEMVSASVEPDTHFSTLGLMSLQFAVLSAKIEERTGTAISPAKLFRCNTAAEMAAAIAEQLPHAKQEERPAPRVEDELAITGMHCVLPYADGYDAFWDNVVSGRDCVELIPRERWDWRAYSEDPDIANKAAFIRGIDRFDAAFFGISPREAELMDPRQRMLLEGVWAALEDAGHALSELRGQPVGIFIGATGDEFAALLQQSGAPADRFSLTGGGRSFLANRISYFFGWHGPSEVIDTTCSSSLVALHNAARAIRNGDCTMAVVAGVNIMIDPAPHVGLGKIGVLSPYGACRTFDASANGYVRGEGIVVMLVEPLQRAEAERHRIHAVLSGTAVNHGGRANALTAPNPAAQTRVISEAMRRSGVDPNQIGAIEAHGTGTPLGDPIEIEALRDAHRAIHAARGETLPAQKRISVGSVKTSIGHLEAAAGIAGLLKTVLMLRHHTLPPLVHFRNLNPQIDVEETPFFFHADARPWPAPSDSLPRVAGVSAFGIGGVNAHAIVREYVSPRRQEARTSAMPRIVPLSARTREQLAASAKRLCDALQRATGPLDDVIHTLQVGREALEERAAMLIRSREELIAALRIVARGDAAPGIWYGHARCDRARVPAPPATASLEALAEAWSCGHPVEWTTIDHAFRTTLPSYPFARVRYWPDALKADRDTVTLTGLESFISDHRIHGVRLLPAAAYLGLAAEAAERQYGRGAYEIRDVVWTRALTFDDESPKTLRLIMDAQRIAFRDDTNDYASAVLVPSADAGPHRLRPVGKSAGVSFTGAECYARLAACGVDYGPSLRVIGELSRNDAEITARLLSRETSSDLPLDPAMLDGAFQCVLLHQILAADWSAEQPIHMPFSVRRVVVHGALPSECFVRATLMKGSSKVRKYAIEVRGIDGELLLELEECTGLPAARPLALRLYRERWRAVADARNGDAPRASHLTIGLPELADALVSSGERVIGNAVLPRLAPHDANCGSAVRWESLLGESIPEATVLWYDGRALSSLPPREQLRFGFDTAFELVRHLLSMRVRRGCIIVAILTDREDDLPTLQALSGFARVVQHEHPGLAFKIVQCRGPRTSCEALVQHIRAVAATDGRCIEHRIDLAAGVHEVISLELETDVVRPAAVLVRRDDVILITGGAGAIGTELANAFVRQGARVGLLGRSPSAALRDPRMRYFQADVTDAAALNAALAEMRAVFGPIQAVFHCAGDAAGGLLIRKPLRVARDVIAARVLGTIAVDEATRNDPIESFVLFSSLGSVTGPVGASDYAYGSRFADLYAGYRNRLAARGERRGSAVAVSWPFWTTSGLKLPEQERDYIRSKGFEPIDGRRAADVLAACFARKGGHYVCAHGDLAKCDAFLTAAYTG
jgi:amino acid adenylation domain-containing protein